MPAKAMRNSSVEWIRILAIVLIIITHANPEALNIPGYDNQMPTTNVVLFFMGWFGSFGLVGDVLFLVCSCWFLVDSRRASVKKIVSMILTVFIVSIIWLAVVLALGYKLTAMEIVRQVFPTIFQNNWFITYYLVFYAIHPLLNMVVRNLDKKGLAALAGVLFAHAFILMWVTGSQLGINKLYVFIVMYFVIAYLKKYAKDFCTNKKLNLGLCLASVVAYFAFRTATNFISLKTGIFDGKLLQYVHIYNPIIFVFAVTLLNLANLKTYHNKVVNHIASLSMLIYIISHNYLFANHIQPQINDWALKTFGENLLIPYVLVMSVIMFVATVILGTIYRFTIERGVDAVAQKVQVAFDRAVEKGRAKRALKRQKAAAIVCAENSQGSVQDNAPLLDETAQTEQSGTIEQNTQNTENEQDGGNSQQQ